MIMRGANVLNVMRKKELYYHVLKIVNINLNLVQFLLNGGIKYIININI